MKSTFEIPNILLHFFSQCLMKVGFAFEVHGIEHLKQIQGPVILAGNHTGLLDSFIVLAAYNKPFRFLMDKKVLGWGIIGKLVRYGNILPLKPKQPKDSLRIAIQSLQHGTSICIFPEGKLSVDGQLGQFQEGVAFLQEKSGVTILPFAISGGSEAWPYGQRLPRLRPVQLRFGEPIPCDTTRERSEVTILLKSSISKMLSPIQSKINSPQCE